MNHHNERDRVEPFGGVIKPGVVDVVDGCGELIVRDGGHDKIRVPHLRLARFVARAASRAGVAAGGLIG